MNGTICFDSLLGMVENVGKDLGKDKKRGNGSHIMSNYQRLCSKLAHSARTRGQIAAAEPRIPKDCTKAWEILRSKKESFGM